MPDVHRIEPHWECFCGAEIANIGTRDNPSYVSTSGTSLCYPGAQGADGTAKHEPYDLDERLRDEQGRYR